MANESILHRLNILLQFVDSFQRKDALTVKDGLGLARRFGKKRVSDRVTNEIQIFDRLAHSLGHTRPNLSGKPKFLHQVEFF
jgi:hypothetical protein